MGDETICFAQNVYVAQVNIRPVGKGNTSHSFKCREKNGKTRWYSKIGDNEGGGVSIDSIVEGCCVSFEYIVVNKIIDGEKKVYYDIVGDVTLISTGNNVSQYGGTMKDNDDKIGVTVGAAFNQASELFAHCSQPFTRDELTNGVAFTRITTLAYDLATSSLHMKQQLENGLPMQPTQQPQQQPPQPVQPQPAQPAPTTLYQQAQQHMQYQAPPPQTQQQVSYTTQPPTQQPPQYAAPQPQQPQQQGQNYSQTPQEHFTST